MAGISRAPSRVAVVACLAAAGLFLFCAPGASAYHLYGKNGKDHREVRMKAGNGGRPIQIDLLSRAKCSKPKFVVPYVLRFDHPFAGGGRHYHDSVSELDGYLTSETGYKTRVEGHLTANRTGKYSWQGTYAYTYKLHKPGHKRPFTTCHLRSTNWYATTAKATLKVHGPASNYVISSQRHYSYKAPGPELEVQGDRDSIFAHFGAFDLRFGPNTKARGALRGGHTYSHTLRFPDRHHPLLDIGADGRGCNDAFGEFRVRRLLLRHGHIVAFNVTFKMSCDGSRSLHGTFDYRK